MGQSTDAKVWFGLAWTEHDDPAYEDGLPEPVITHLKLKELDANGDECQSKEDGEAVVEKILEAHGCELVRHCYVDGAEMLGLAISDSYICAWRGYPKNLSITGPITTGTVSAEWLDHLKQAAAAVGWPWVPPAWWLASYWC